MSQYLRDTDSLIRTYLLKGVVLVSSFQGSTDEITNLHGELICAMGMGNLPPLMTESL